MKKYSIWALTLAFMLSGCHTYDKFTIAAPIETKIYVPAAETAESHKNIGASGRVRIQVPSSTYCGYVVATDPISGLDVPYGLNVKKKTYPGEKIAMWSGVTLASIGACMDLIGGLAIIAAATQDDEENTELFGQVIGVGGGLVLTGVGLGWPANARLNQMSHHYQFKYDSNQQIGFDGLSSVLLNPDLPKNAPVAEPSKRKKATSGQSDAEDETASERGTKAKKTRSDFGKNIAGTYSGNGRLLIGKVEDEAYSTIIVKIERIDKNNVKVRILESDEDFFESPLTYIIVADKKGGYKLTLKDVPSATILIDKNGKLVFNHNKVYIDGDVYTLTINARRQ